MSPVTVEPIVYPAEALVGNQDRPEAGVGFEPAARATRLILTTQLNDEISRQSDRWKLADSALQQLGLDLTVGQIDVPHIPLANFHEGPHRSLIEADPDQFPNCSVMAYQTVRSPSSFADQLDSSDITLFIEMMAMTGPVPAGLEVSHETIVHRYIQRMTEALAIVMARADNHTLLGVAHNLQTPPRGGVGNSSWIKRQNKGAGAKFLWQGSRLQYTLQRHHATSF